MIRLISSMLFGITVALAAGCNSEGHQSWSNFWFRGTAKEQQLRAQRFDPYPQDNIAPPIGGGRPREYDRPYTAPKQDYLDRTDPNWATYGRTQR